MNVHLAIPNLSWPDREALPPVDSGRLAALEQLLAKGRRTRIETTSLETWLIGAWQAEGGTAAYAFLGDGGDPGAATWVRADPCHIQVNRDQLVLLDATTFDLAREEAEALAETLNRHFADAGLVFYPMQPERWYARVDAEAPVDAMPLALARGKPVTARPGAGEALTRWHALANEIQMLLHEHPVNEARERRGELPINAVWFWGGGKAIAPAATPFRRVRADDPLAAGLARASHAQVLPLPDSAAPWLRSSPREGVELIVIDTLSAPASYREAAAWRERLTALEVAWFAPLLEVLRAGRIGMVSLHAIGPNGTLDVETTRQDLRYFWRRAKPLAAYTA